MIHRLSLWAVPRCITGFFESPGLASAVVSSGADRTAGYSVCHVIRNGASDQVLVRRGFRPAMRASIESSTGEALGAPVVGVSCWGFVRMSDLLTPSQAARVLDLSPSRLKQLGDEGRIRMERNVYGRLFDADDVRRFAEERRLSSFTGDAA